MLSKLSGIVEIDEAYIGGKRRVKNNPGGGPREGEKEIQVGKRTWIQKNPWERPRASTRTRTRKLWFRSYSVMDRCDPNTFSASMVKTSGR